MWFSLKTARQKAKASDDLEWLRLCGKIIGEVEQAQSTSECVRTQPVSQMFNSLLRRLKLLLSTNLGICRNFACSNFLTKFFSNDVWSLVSERLERASSWKFHTTSFTNHQPHELSTNKKTFPLENKKVSFGKWVFHEFLVDAQNRMADIPLPPTRSAGRVFNYFLEKQ